MRAARPFILAFLFILLILAGGGVFWFLEMRTGAEPVAQAAGQYGRHGMPPMPVEAEPVKLDTVTETVSAVGTLRSNESVIVRPEIAGLISSINFREGQPVNQGALLFGIDDSIYQAELRDAQARLALSRRNAERARELYRRGAGTARAQDEAMAQLAIDEAAVALAQARLDKTRIRAPFAGVMGLRLVSVGDYVQSGEDLANLEDISPLKVDFRVPERYLTVVAPDQRLNIQVDAFPGRTFEGTVYAIDPLIDADGRSIALRARIANKDELLRPGLFSRVALLVASRENAIVVPEQAIVPRGDEHFVFKVENKKAVLQQVTLGQRRTGDVEVVAGLNPGDVIVTAGQMKIQDGAAVMVLNTAPPAGV